MVNGMFKKAAVAAAMLAGVASASAAGVFQEFTINETVIPGANVIGAANSALVVDKLNGSYTEVLTVTGPGTFAAQAFAEFSSFLANDGTAAVPSLLNNLEAFGGYKLYAVFSASGAITGPNAFQSSNNRFDLFLDPLSNTSATLTNGTAPPTLSSTADDILLAFAGPTLTFGTGNLSGPPGAFNIDWKDFSLTAFGQTMFIDPVPFHMAVRVNGDYDILNTLPPGNTVRITGDVSAVFPVSEPTTLALVGLALMGMGIAARSRKQV